VPKRPEEPHRSRCCRGVEPPRVLLPEPNWFAVLHLHAAEDALVCPLR
jgi:hypothetical protein